MEFKSFKKNLRYINFSVLKLRAGESYEKETKNEEIGLVLISGQISLGEKDDKWRKSGFRKDVFHNERAWAVYLPPYSFYEILSIKDSEIALCSAPAKKRGKLKWISPKDVRKRVVGKDNWKRNVYDIIYENVEAEHILIGETFNPSGNWSSYPPHKHDEDNLPEESKLEEVYFFKVNPETGFGFQRIFTDDGKIDKAIVIKDNSIVAIPSGYHPVVVAPGHKLYYLWFLAGEKRILKPHEWRNTERTL